MFVTDERLRRIGWGSLIVVTALMLTEYNGVSLPPERVLFPDAAFTKPTRGSGSSADAESS